MKCISAIVIMAFVAIASAAVIPSISQFASIPEPKELWTAPAFTYEFAPKYLRSLPLAYSSPFTWARTYVEPYVEPYFEPTVVSIIPGEAKYTALTRGAVHEAPLPGHELSQTSINLEPAPGTF